MEEIMGKYLIRETSTGTKFDLLATNGQVIATSEVYSSLAATKNGIESVRNIAPTAKLEDQTTDPVESQTNPKFEMYKDKAGEFRFRLKARNGEIVVFSEGYTSKSNCLNGIESVRNNSDSDVTEE